MKFIFRINFDSPSFYNLIRFVDKDYPDNFDLSMPIKRYFLFAYIADNKPYVIKPLNFHETFSL